MYLVDKIKVKERYTRSVKTIKTLIETMHEDSEQVNSLLSILEDLEIIMDFEKIANHVHEGICIYNNEGKVIYVNESFVNITKHSFEEINKKDFSGFEFLGNKHILDKKDTIKKEGIFNTIIQSLRTNKKILVSSTAILDNDNKMNGIIETYRDVTELENIEEKLKKFKKEVDLLSRENLKNELLLDHIQRQQENHNFIAKSKEMEIVREMIKKVAEFDVTVVINGETGCGKEVIANEIYKNSKRNREPFIKLNCAAIPANLLEAELFGYEKGAFTGANPGGKIGMFELADKGTLLLDEIGEMSIELQSKLLRAIQNKEIMRIGGTTKAIKIDIRILASTHRDLLDLVRQGKFREDLYYRLNVFPIYIPPLRLRTNDIEELVNHFIKLFNLKYSKLVTISDSGMEVMKSYYWPGNVRELQNVIERLIIISEYEESIDSNQIKVLLGSDISEEVLLEEDMGLKEIQEYVEKKYIKRALKLGGSTRKAAKILKIDQSTVVRKAQKYGIEICDAE